MISNVRLSKTAILQTAIAFRLGREAEASEDLVTLIDSLSRDLHSIPPDTLAELAVIMQQIFDAQTRRDSIGIADHLEHEMLTKLLPTGLLIDKPVSQPQLDAAKKSDRTK
jgi:hypothetical protein